MRNILLTLLGLVQLFCYAQTTYYSCSTSGENSTDPTGTSPACAASTAWNSLGNTLIVQSGHTFNFNISIKNFELDGNITIEEGAIMNLTQSGQGENIRVNAVFQVNGTLNVTSSTGKDFKFKVDEANTGNGELNVGGNGSISGTSTGAKVVKIEYKNQSTGEINGSVDINGEFKVKSQLTLNSGGSINAPKFKTDDDGVELDIDGIVSATTIEFKKVSTIDGTGTFDSPNNLTGNSVGNLTVNGETVDWSATDSVAIIEYSEFVWMGSWAGGNIPSLDDVAKIEGNYSTSVNGTLASSNFFVSSGDTLSFDSNDNLDHLANVQIDGVAEIIDNTIISTGVDLSGSGKIILKRNFTRKGWHHLGWPVKSGYTLGDLILDENIAYNWEFDYTDPVTDTTNVFYWDASVSSWEVPTAATDLSGMAFSIYVFSTTSSITLVIDPEDLNTGLINQSFAYNDPGSDAPGNANIEDDPDGWAGGVTSGWNLWINPFQRYVSISDLQTELNAISGMPLETVIYAYTGSGYSNSSSGLTGLYPNQAFFLRSKGTGGTHSITSASSSGTQVGSNYFKTQQELIFTIRNGKLE